MIRFLFAAIFAALPSLVFADDLSNQSVGASIFKFFNSMHMPALSVIHVGSLVAGIALIGGGLKGVYDYGQNPQQRPNMPASVLFLFLGGGCMLGLPTITHYGINSFFQSSTSGSQISNNMMDARHTENCFNAQGEGEGITCVAKNIATNVTPMFNFAFFGTCFILGFLMLFQLFKEGAESYNSGRKQLSRGYYVKLSVAVLLCSLSQFVTALRNSMGITEEVNMEDENNMLSYTASGDGVSGKYNQLIGYCFQIMIIFGLISIFRGLLSMKKFAEGQSNKTFSASCVHLVSGVCLVYSHWTVCTVMNTFWGSGHGFCSQN